MMDVPLFQSELYRADLFRTSLDNKRLVVTFTEGGHDKLEGFGFAAGYFLLRHGFDVVAVKSLSETWYADMPADLIKCLADVSASERYDHRSGYGSSSGAYAAILFSGRLGFDSVLAISPQFDVTQEWDVRWRDKAMKMGPMRRVTPSDLSPGCRYVLVFDPYDADRLHVEHYRDIIPADHFCPLAVPHSGHPSGYFLHETSALQRIAFSVLSGAAIQPSWKRVIRNGRRLSGRYFFNLARHLFQARKRSWAKLAAKRALELDPLDPESHMIQAAVLETLGDFKPAVVHAATAVALNPQHPDMAAVLSRLLHRVGKREQALVFIDRAIEISSARQAFIDQRIDQGSR